MNKVNINGKDYGVRFSIKAMIEFEKSTGTKITSLKGGADELSINEVIELCYAALKDGARKNKTKLKRSEDKDWLIDEISDNPNLLPEILNAFKDSTATKKKKRT